MSAKKVSQAKTPVIIYRPYCNIKNPPLILTLKGKLSSQAIVITATPVQLFLYPLNNFVISQDNDIVAYNNKVARF